MARLAQTGFELNSAANGVEVTLISALSISSTTFRNGAFAANTTSLVSATARGFRITYSGATVNGPIFNRFSFDVATLPSAENRIVVLNDTNDLLTPVIYLTLDNSGILRLYDEDGQITGTSTLSTNTYYTIDVKMDRTGAGGAHIVEGRVNGVVFATDATRNLSVGILNFAAGGNLNSEAQTTGSWFFDDIAINDGTGSFETSYPETFGRITNYQPNAPGDNAQWTRGGTDSGVNWSQVNEVTPNDATNFVSSNTLNNEDLHNIVNTGAEIAALDTINTVTLFGRSSGAGASANASFKYEIEASAGGTIEQSVAITPANANWTSAVASAIVLYDLPGASTVPWTKSDINNAQIGYKLTAASTNAARVSTIWITVDSTAVVPVVYKTLLGVGQI